MFGRCIQTLIGRLGYMLVRKDSYPPPGGMEPLQGYDLEPEAIAAIQLVRSHTMLTYPRLVTLYQQVVYCENHGIVGDFVECGTWKGGAVGIMALANLKWGTARRDIHLFDSFEGVPEPDRSVDGEEAVRFARAAGGGVDGKLVPLKRAYESVGTLEVNRALLEEVIGYDKEHLHYHKGWFQDTLPTDAHGIDKIAILRLDGDWYSSTKVCLEYLYSKVVRGGFVIVDDYNYCVGCRKAIDEFMAKEDIHAFLIHIDRPGRYWIKP